MKIPKRIIKQRANLNRLKYIAFDLVVLDKAVKRIQGNFDLIALDMIGKARKTDERK